MTTETKTATTRLSYAAVLRRMAARAAYTHDEDTCELIVGADTAPCTCGVTADLHALRALAALVEEAMGISNCANCGCGVEEHNADTDQCDEVDGEHCDCPGYAYHDKGAVMSLLSALAAGFDPPRDQHTATAPNGEAGSAPKLESRADLHPTGTQREKEGRAAAVPPTEDVRQAIHRYKLAVVRTAEATLATVGARRRIEDDARQALLDQFSELAAPSVSQGWVEGVVREVNYGHDAFGTVRHVSRVIYTDLPVAQRVLVRKVEPDTVPPPP